MVHDSLVSAVGEAVVHAVFVEILLRHNTAHIVGSFAGASRVHFCVIRHGAHKRADLPLVEHGHLINRLSARVEVRLSVNGAAVAADRRPGILGLFLHHNDLGAKLGSLAGGHGTGIAAANNEQIAVDGFCDVARHLGLVAKPRRRGAAICRNGARLTHGHARRARGSGRRALGLRRRGNRAAASKHAESGRGKARASGTLQKRTTRYAIVLLHDSLLGFPMLQAPRPQPRSTGPPADLSRRTIAPGSLPKTGSFPKKPLYHV